MAAAVPMIDRRMEAKDGRLILPTASGLGFNFDETCLKAHGLGGWI